MEKASQNPRKVGVLLINVGTPDDPTPEKVREYLREFLMDPYVIDIPWALRWFFVNLVILRKRPATSAEAYQKVWTDRGSPLLFHLEDLARKVRGHLGTEEWVILPAMRYGRPSMAQAIEELKRENVSEVLLFPMYPQYSIAATESALAQARGILKSKLPQIPLRSVAPFFKHKLFINNFAGLSVGALNGFSPDHILFSFHGLPERHVKRTDRTRAHCLAQNSCCDEILDQNQDCYRAQCYTTAKLIAREMKLSEENYTVCFQSRLGRTPWIRPFTDELYLSLPKQGVKRLAVVCPSFVADCLETLEEVEIRGKKAFFDAGGSDFKMIPSLNATDEWALSVAQIIRENAL